ncbi:MAG: ABC transporter permease [Prevotellaceae bacterium]|jgi:ABC-type antimicrobial peptide transport system permease subunit|nr:ABC transporter permease [Prevotellaceae bacterium]
MKKMYGYIASAWYNILRSKAYALLYIISTAVAFVFITIIVEFFHVVKSDAPPFVNGSRAIHLCDFKDINGKKIRGFNAEEASLFAANVDGIESYAVSDMQYMNAWLNSRFTSFMASFVNGEYWSVNKFTFTEGRAFTAQENESKKAVAVIKESAAKRHFKSKNIIGQKVEFQKREYTIIGVVADYSSLANSSYENLWLPEKFNTFASSGRGYYDLYLLFPKNAPLASAKQRVANALNVYFSGQGKEVAFTPEKIHTVQEEKLQTFGGVLSYGIPVAILLLLLIPALNAINLNAENVSNRAAEVAIRRAMGGSLLASFTQLMVESLMLALLGAAVGILFANPVANFIARLLFGDGLFTGFSFISGLSITPIVGVMLPLLLLFALLSGGIPAYLTSKKSIATILGGGAK